MRAIATFESRKQLNEQLSQENGHSMAEQATRSESGLKDYYLTLRLHPSADAKMVDQAYWHLARAFGADGGSEREAKERMDELNEAYSVLGSPEQRAKYERARAGVQDEGAEPASPSPETTHKPSDAVHLQNGATEETSRRRRSWSIPRLFPRNLPRLSAPRIHIPTLSAPGTTSQTSETELDTEELRSSTAAIRARLRAAGEHVTGLPPATPDKPTDSIA